MWAVGEVQASQAMMVAEIPRDGIAFRGVDGRMVARLRGEANGGRVEMQDKRGRTGLRLAAATPSVGAIGANVDAIPPPPAPPLVLDRMIDRPADPHAFVSGPGY